METQHFTIKDIKKIQDELEHGKVIAFPTDTVFGVGCYYDKEDALTRLKAAKQRDAHKPIPLMVGNKEQISMVAIVSDEANKLIQAFMPGSLTLILPKQEGIASYITNGLDSIAIRMPDDELLLNLMQRKPMLVSSANLSGELPGKDEREVLQQLEGRIDGIVAGEAKENIPSTIIDMTKTHFKIIRAGTISEQMILEAIKEA